MSTIQNDIHFNSRRRSLRASAFGAAFVLTAALVLIPSLIGVSQSDAMQICSWQMGPYGNEGVYASEADVDCAGVQARHRWKQCGSCGINTKYSSWDWTTYEAVNGAGGLTTDNSTRARRLDGSRTSWAYL